MAPDPTDESHQKPTCWVGNPDTLPQRLQRAPGATTAQPGLRRAKRDGGRREARRRGGSAQLRPALGLRPWLAFLRRALVLRLSVFFGIRVSTLRRGTVAGPGHEVVGGPRVDDPLGLDAVPGGLVAAVVHELEVAGGVGIGVDADEAVPLQGQGEQLV